ncbi:peroxiredoxin-like family protein [Streptomyces albidoflavus]
MDSALNPVPAPPRPRTQAPPLTVPMVGGGTWELAQRTPRNFTMIVFYRGLHCPACRNQLAQLEASAGELQNLGVEAVAISADTEERAARARDEWGLRETPVGYGLSVKAMREWGLFVSEATHEQEPEYFNEPGLFLIKPDLKIYYEALTSMPFGRPAVRELIGGMSFVIENAYPARGNA